MSASGIGFLLHPGEQRTIEAAVARAQSHGYDVWSAVEEPEKRVQEHAGDTSLLVTVGGDGTFLYGARLAAPLGIPVIGVNRGRLGFLNDIEVDRLPEAITRFATGQYRTQLRSLIDVHVSAANVDRRSLALNEVVVRARDVMVARLRVDIDDELLGAFDSDGVVVATATGSTAYALSAGGPPVDPRLHALCVVPLAPHAVISRPVVVPDAVNVRVTLERGQVFVASDGISLADMSESGTVTVSPGPELQVVRFADSPSFQARLREKFRFGIPHKDMRDAEAEDLWREQLHSEGERDAS